MSALALNLKAMGEMVIGSDKEEYFFTEDNLIKAKIPFFKFNKNNINKYQTYTYIISYAYNENNNEEVADIINKGYKYYYYSDFINQYYNNKAIIGVSGTHGKTTTATLLKQLFSNESIAYIIGDGSGGGKLNCEYLILEACEYQCHFISYDYEYLIINNIDYDHPDFYNSIDETIIAFKNASKKAKCIIVNNDDKNAKKIKHRCKYTFGIENKSFVTAKIIQENSEGYKIKVNVKEKEYIFSLPFYGRHMIYNFLASFTIYYLIKDDKNTINDNISQSLLNYIPPKRRINETVLTNNNIIVDDYAHHPTEIIATYKAIKHKYQNYEISIVFQPHTYSRTIFLHDEFINAFNNKNVYIMNTFISREFFDSQKEKVVKEIFSSFYQYEQEKILSILHEQKQIVIFMGAGNINNEIKQIIAKFNS